MLQFKTSWNCYVEIKRKEVADAHPDKSHQEVCGLAGSVAWLTGKRRKERGGGRRGAGEQHRGDEVVKVTLSFRAVLTCQSLALSMSLT